MNDITLNGFLREREVCELTSLARTTLWRLRRRGEFPTPHTLTTGRKGYARREIADWLAAHGRADANADGGSANGKKD